MSNGMATIFPVPQPQYGSIGARAAQLSADPVFPPQGARAFPLWRLKVELATLSWPLCWNSGTSSGGIRRRIPDWRLPGDELVAPRQKRQAGSLYGVAP